MLSFIVLSGVLSNSTLWALRVVPLFPPRIFAREPVPVRIDLRNGKKRFPSFALSLYPQSETIESHGRAFVLKIPPGGECAAVHQIRFPSRGRVRLPPYRVETAYPFGLIRKFLTVSSEGETVVYPALLPVDTGFVSDRRFQGDYLSGRKGESANPYGIRDFVHGDPAKIIHWKSSAKSGEWKVKEFEREKRMKVMVDLRLEESSRSETLTRERAVSTAASLISLLPSLGFEIGLRLNGERIEGEGQRYVDAYLTALALVSPPSRTDLRPLPPEELETTVLVSDLPVAALPRSGLRTIGREELVSA
jgi:uncharacterized protein (DUF58 family)